MIVIKPIDPVGATEANAGRQPCEIAPKIRLAPKLVQQP